MDQIQQERAAHWETTGAYFGYPECCIQAFVTRCLLHEFSDLSLDHPFFGTGYVPCKPCRSKDPAYICEIINQKRDPKLPPFKQRAGA